LQHFGAIPGGDKSQQRCVQALGWGTLLHKSSLSYRLLVSWPRYASHFKKLKWTIDKNSPSPMHAKPITQACLLLVRSLPAEAALTPHDPTHVCNLPIGLPLPI
jgi:hypothetical protein